MPGCLLPPAPASPDESRLLSPTGFTLRQIRRLLGRAALPDYAVLSGVPHPRPCAPAFVLDRSHFRPFRPFRWRYHQHMALTRLDPDYWLELERGYRASLAVRHALLAEHGERVVFCSGGGEGGPEKGQTTVDLACRELLEMALQFLCRRYPPLFCLEQEERPEKEGAPPATAVFFNRVLGTRTPLPPDLDGRACLRILFDHVPEDFAIMLRSSGNAGKGDGGDGGGTGRYVLRAAAVCSSVGWHIGQHRDRPLGAIHTGVTDYAARMARSMDRYFARLPTDQPIQRGSWTIEGAPVLFGERPEAEVPDTADLHLRCDWQTLRRLPLTGAVVFNFKAVFAPLSALRTEPRVPALLHRVLRDGDPRLVVPGKCTPAVRAAALPALAAWAAEQVAQGTVPADWEPSTLDESPFFPGWEARWHVEQGF